MKKSLWRTDKEVEEIYKRHVKTVYRVCFAYMKNSIDTEDAVQDTFYKMIVNGPVFESEEHEKAWLIRTSTNVCKNKLKHWFRRERVNFDDYENVLSREPVEVDDLFELVMDLPNKYKTVVYLYYYEGYNSREIANILKKPSSTIRNHLHEARGILREKTGEDFYEK